VSLTGTPRVVRLVGVYDADGTPWGELRYWVGARLGRTHCSLCEITHGLVRERASWQACRAALPVAFDTYHRDDQPAAARAAAGGAAPVVLAETVGGWVVLVGPEVIESCHGSSDTLVAAVRRAVASAGLSLGDPAEGPVP
jgi:hypothetical protein